MALTDDEARTLGFALMGKLCDLTIQAKVKIAAKAGLDVSAVPSAQYNLPVNNALLKAFGALSPPNVQLAIPIIASELETCGTHGPDVQRLLGQHGFEFRDGHFRRGNVFDEREKLFIPALVIEDLRHAFDELANGKEGDALTAAFGAVDTLTNAIYDKNQAWGPAPNSFQAKVMTVFKRLDIYGEMLSEMLALGVKQEDAEEIVGELAKATERMTFAMQAARRGLSSVHGRKPSYTRLTYECVKWASAICGLLKGKV